MKKLVAGCIRPKKNHSMFSSLLYGLKLKSITRSVNGCMYKWIYSWIYFKAGLSMNFFEIMISNKSVRSDLLKAIPHFRQPNVAVFS